MASDTEICNLALTRARVGTIDDLDTEQSAEAEKCRILFPLARDHCLEKYAWRFAKATVALALTGNTPTEWQYEYGYPSDAARLLYVIPAGVGQAAVKNYTGYIAFEPVPYEMSVADDSQSRVILCNSEDVYAAYTRKVTNNDLYSAQFIQALAWYLAADLAISFGGDSAGSIRKLANDEWLRNLSEATAHDANQAQRNNKRLPQNIAVRAASLPSHYYYNGAYYRRY